MKIDVVPALAFIALIVATFALRTAMFIAPRPEALPPTVTGRNITVSCPYCSNRFVVSTVETGAVGKVQK
ncbi:hypothetical protein [Singulisphaera sp. PoT]|uniref:hypothetical protein n=1 Tax=Singulisphaera sp. PoT TaxID=3411797 RepID=UPI003BF54A41